MNAPRLTDITLLNGPAEGPGYSPGEHGAGIVHLGVGAFHRAHQAVMTDDALARQGGDWRIIGVSLRSTAIAKELNPQNGLYTLIERDENGTKARIVGAVQKVIAANPAATLDALCDPSIRVVTLTVTEKGYGIDRQVRGPDAAHPAVKADLAQPDAPAGVLGLLTAAIKQRRQAGHVPFTVLSCDNLPENGALLRDGVIGFAKLSGDAELSDWIAQNIAFPSSMVDRITPASTDETRAEAQRQTGCEDQATVETEPFIQWVIEDHFPTGRPQWEEGGALFVSDVAPYEKMKLTMLNGSHSMLAYTGFLAGRRYVRDVMADPALAQLVKRHLKAAGDLLQPLPGIDVADYAAALAQRFRNPAIAHETYQIAMDGSQKLPQRIFQPALVALDTGSDLRPFAFATAMWMRFCLGRLDDGTAHDLRDPREVEITAALGDVPRSARAISDAVHILPNLIPQRLGADPDWRTHIEQVLSAALNQGCLSAIQQEARRT
ncbi:mannitol dehydrogenase family protein [Primorskyibacter flagellatus]|uniref:mannitol dehydrogenase family protein n=1 Tax=Primorskyibacter flagellatus TaxID=1387277 RepID=UPI003A955E9F